MGRACAIGRALNLAEIDAITDNPQAPEFRTIQQEMAPKISEFNSKITQNEKLFARVKAVYESEEMKNLRADQQRPVQLTYDSFARNGATLNGDDKKRYAAINQRLAELHTQFVNNVLADEEGYVTYLTQDRLSALPQFFIDATASAAASRGRIRGYPQLNGGVRDYTEFQSQLLERWLCHHGISRLGAG